MRLLFVPVKPASSLRLEMSPGLDLLVLLARIPGRKNAASHPLFQKSFPKTSKTILLVGDKQGGSKYNKIKDSAVWRTFKEGIFLSNDVTLDRAKLFEQLMGALESYKILYIGCHTGWGKTTATCRFLEKAERDYDYLSACDACFLEKLQMQTASIAVLDDLHLLQDAQEINTLVEHIAGSDHQYFLLSRTALPPYLKPFSITRQLRTFGMEDLAFSVEETEQLLRQSDVTVSRALCEKIHADTKGWAVSVGLCARRLRTEIYSETTVAAVKLDLFDYFDAILFDRWPLRQQEFLMDVSCFPHLGIKLAEMMTGRRDAASALTEALSMGSFLQFMPPSEYRFFPLFREYLQKKQRELCTPAHIHQLYQNAGLYYELEDDLPKAMACYRQADNMDKLAALLIENSNRSASNAQFYETEPYYRCLPQGLIERSPELMSAMSMLESLCCHPEESEKWFACLEQYKNQIDKASPSYKTAREKLLYLTIALPHRGSLHVFDLIRDAVEVCAGSKLKLQEISITGDMPSLMNGGKDFMEWSKKDKNIYLLLKAPVELVFGKCGVGLADAALGESLFEKNTTLNFTDELSHLNTALSQTMLRGSDQVQFATLGVMARTFIAQGSLDTASNLIENFRVHCVSEKRKTFMPNIFALQARLAMLRGDTDAVAQWMKGDAPNELSAFYTLSRYQYLTKVRGYLLEARYLEAVSLLNLLKIYYERYGRPYGVLETQLLHAVVLFRMKDGRWEETITAVLTKCEEYGFTRLFADEGMALFPLLNKLTYRGDQAYFSTVLALTREQALRYPDYLVPAKKLKNELTPPELSVLRLLVQGKRNDEIADFLGIAVSTVKFHIGHIFAKLDVKNRSQAIRAAAELELL